MSSTKKLCNKDTSSNTINDQVENEVAKKLIIIIVLCALFMVMEIVGGLLANSLAIICDAFHLLSDLGGFVISLISSYLAARKASKNMNFGFRRVEILGAFLSIIFIWLLTAALFYLAINRIVYSDYKIDAKIMIVLAGCGVVVNALMAFTLSYTHTSKDHKSHAKDPLFIAPKIIDSTMSLPYEKLNNITNIKSDNGGGSSPIDTVTKDDGDSSAKNEKLNFLVSRNINIRAAFIHIIGDLIQSIGVLIAALIIFYKPSLKIADPICTIIFSVIVISTTVPIMNDIVNVLSESFPKQLNYDDIIKLVSGVSGVKEVKDLKVWYLSTDSFAVNLLVLVDSSLMDNQPTNSCFLENLVADCKAELLKISDFKHVNIQLDFEKKNSNTIAKNLNESSLND